MKRIWEPVAVTLRPGGTEPATFVWEGKQYWIRQVETVWKEMGLWWDGEGEKTFFRVQGSGFRLQDSRGVYELCLDETSGRWMLNRIID